MMIYGLIFLIIAVTLILIGYFKRIKFILVLFSIILTLAGTWIFSVSLVKPEIQVNLLGLGLIIWIIGATLVFLFMTYKYSKTKITLELRIQKEK